LAPSAATEYYLTFGDEFTFTTSGGTQVPSMMDFSGQ